MMTTNLSFSNCCGFGRDAIRHVDRFANAGRLLTVAAFAVYIQINRSSLTSELDASHCCFVCAWLIAYAQIQVFEADYVLQEILMGKNDMTNQYKIIDESKWDRSMHCMVFRNCLNFLHILTLNHFKLYGFAETD